MVARSALCSIRPRSDGKGGCGLSDPFADMAEQKGYTPGSAYTRCLKRDSFFSFFFLFYSFFNFNFFFFHRLPEHQWLCSIPGKNAPAAVRVVSFFQLRARPRKTYTNSVRAERRGGCGVKTFFFLS